MSTIKSILLAAAVAVGATIAGAGASLAAPVHMPGVGLPQLEMNEEAAVHKVRHRRYRRFRHGQRFRRRRGPYIHFHGGYWYAYPWWFAPRYDRCEYWHRRCRANWGGGADYRGCMRYHGC